MNFLFIFLFIFFSIFNNETVLVGEKKNMNTIDNKNYNKEIKRRKVDISILRENLITELISILNCIELALNKLLNDFKRENFISKYKEVMDIFHCINECISKFNNDPLSYGRSEIEEYLNQAQKYRLFLNSI
jgi:hypothetical protein